MILAYETSTQVCSVSFRDDKGTVHEKRIEGRSVHSEYVFLYTKEFMNEFNFRISDLDAVLVSNGPGSYTGLRIAASAIKGILFGEEVRLYKVNTLASMAMLSEAGSGETIHAILDARRTHFYHQSFKLKDTLTQISEAAVIEIAEFEESVRPGDIILGTGLDRLNRSKVEGAILKEDVKLTAKSLITLFELPDREQFCTEVRTEELDPDYISTSQVNNSKP